MIVIIIIKHFSWCNYHHLLMALYKKKSVKSVKVYKFKGFIIMNCKFSLRHSVVPLASAIYSFVSSLYEMFDK